MNKTILPHDHYVRAQKWIPLQVPYSNRFPLAPGAPPERRDTERLLEAWARCSAMPASGALRDSGKRDPAQPR